MTSRIDHALIALRQILRATEISSRALAKQCGLTPSQLILMELVSKSGGSAPGELAKQISLSHATVTALIDKLEDRKLVKRTPDAADKRRVLVLLTEKGAGTLQSAPSILQQRFERGFAKLEEWEQVMSSIGRFALKETVRQCAVSLLSWYLAAAFQSMDAVWCDRRSLRRSRIAR